MLSQYDPKRIHRALQEASPTPAFPPASDRAAWEATGAALGREAVATLVDRAEAARQLPIPVLTATLYLEAARTDQRAGYETPMGLRRRRLASLALAECLEGHGRFLDAILDHAWAICEESSWAYPAHQRVLADPRRPQIDLGAAMTALGLAELDHLLGDRLDPALGVRIRAEVDHRCLVPFLTRHDNWWRWSMPGRTVNNWTAVCTGGIAAAAISLESDPERLAEILGRAAWSLEDYLASFDPDGGTDEGVGYWSYGFGYFVLLAHLVEHRTDGRISFLDDPRVREIARFPLRTVLSPGRWATFSDIDPAEVPNPTLLAFLARRLALPELTDLVAGWPDRPSRAELAWGLRWLAWRPDAAPAARFRPARRDWFRGQQWLVARQDPEDPDALVLAVKGGHNGESHNHNDVGSIIVHVAGESVATDLGSGRYTLSYFGPERYDYFVKSSRGHSVPVVNGHVQIAGGEHGAELLARGTDDAIETVSFELRDVYPAGAGLTSLRRTVTLRRDVPAGRVEVTDEAAFATGAGRLESVLITLGQVEVSSDTVLLRGERGGLRVAFDPAVVTPRVEIVEDVELQKSSAEVRREAEDARSRCVTVGRVVFAAAPAESARIALSISPERPVG